MADVIMEVRKFKLIENGLFLQDLSANKSKGAKKWTWAVMFNSSRDLSRQKVELQFQLDYANNGEDILYSLLNFTMFFLSFSNNKDALRVKAIRLNIALKTMEETHKVESILANYYKFIHLFLSIPFSITINNNPISFTHYKAEMSHRYLPAFPLNKESINLLFTAKVKDLLGRRDIKEIDFMSVDSSRVLSEFLLQFIRDTLCGNRLYAKKSRKIQVPDAKIANVQSIFDEYFPESSLFKALVASVFFHKFDKKEKNETNKADLLSRFKYYFDMANIVSLGAVEIADNILKHTEKKSGLLFFRIHENRKPAQLNLTEKYYQTELNDVSDWIELSILDHNSQGLLDTYNSKNKAADDIVRLSDLFVSKEDAFNSAALIQNRQNRDYVRERLFGKGLKILKHHIIKAHGYFSVETGNIFNGGHKQTLRYHDYYHKAVDEMDFRDDTEAVGSKYRILVPVIKFNSESISATSLDNTAIVRMGTRGFDYYETMAQYLDDQDICTYSWHDGCIDGSLQTPGEDKKEVAEKTLDMVFSVIGEGSETAKVLLVNCNNLDGFQKYGIDLKKLIYYHILFAHKERQYIVFVNMNSGLIEDFISTYTDILRADKLTTNPWVYLFDATHGFPRIAKGWDSHQNNRYNSYYRQLRLISNASGKEENANQLDSKIKSDLLFPVEVLLGKGMTAPVFALHVKELLNKDFNEDGFGMKHNEHVKLGSKLHVDAFFQAELLFENSYYTDCFAYIVARYIVTQLSLKNTEKKLENIIVVGYKEYSKALIVKINRLIEEYLKRKNDSGCKVKSVIYYEREDDLKAEFNKVSGHLDNALFVFVVPISSTLKTFNKMHSDIVRCLLSMPTDAQGKNYGLLKDICPKNYTVIELRDELEGTNDKTKIEASYGWSSINNESIYIYGDYPFNNIKCINYFICEQAKWYHANECNICDQNEKPLIKTHSSSLMLETNAGIPHIVKRGAYISNCDDSMYIQLAKHLHYGHISRNGNHFLYYIDTNSFFDATSKIRLNCWANYLKKPLEIESQDDNVLNVLLVPEHYSNIEFAEWVMQEIFERVGVVIREDFTNEFYSNFIKKYSYISQQAKNSGSKLRFFFVDDILNTGKTFTRCHTLAQDLVEHGKCGNEFQIDVISLINRLDHQNYNLVQKLCKRSVTSFIEVYIPIIKEQLGTCWLCEEYDTIHTIAKSSTDLKFSEFAAKLAKKYLKEVDATTSDSFDLYDYRERGRKSYIQERFRMENRIYSELVALTARNADENCICTAFGLVNGVIGTNVLNSEKVRITDYSYKMNLIRIISMPFFSYFTEVRKIAHDLCKNEINILLGNEIYDDSAKATESIKYLSILLTQLGMLSSPFILQKDNIKAIWMYYSDCMAKVPNEQKEELQFAFHYICALKHLYKNDQVLAFALVKNALELYNELKAEDEMKDFLKLIILENDGIFQHAIEAYEKDSMLLDSLKLPVQNIVSNYYYETVKNICSLFVPMDNTGDKWEQFTYNIIEAIYKLEKETSEITTRITRLVSHLKYYTEKIVYYEMELGKNKIELYIPNKQVSNCSFNKQNDFFTGLNTLKNIDLMDHMMYTYFDINGEACSAITEKRYFWHEKECLLNFRYSDNKKLLKGFFVILCKKDENFKYSDENYIFLIQKMLSVGQTEIINYLINNKAYRFENNRTSKESSNGMNTRKIDGKEENNNEPVL